MVDLLVDGFGTVIPDHAVAEAYAPPGTAPNRRATRSMMQRLGRRLRDVGLELHKVRGRGYLLELDRTG